MYIFAHNGHDHSKEFVGMLSHNYVTLGVAAVGVIIVVGVLLFLRSKKKI